MIDVSTDRPVPASGVRTRRLPPRASGIAIAVLLGLAVVAYGWYRLPPITRSTLWAEDSRLFLTERLQSGPLGSLLEPYDGYQHFVVRIVTDVTTAVFPVGHYAQGVTFTSLVVVGCSAACLYVFSAGQLTSRLARVLLGAVPVVLPVVTYEVLGNTANLHSFALFLAPVLLLYRAPTRTRAWWQAVVAFLVAMTEVQSVVFLPLLLVTARRRRGWPASGAFLVGIAVQTVSVLVSKRSRPPFVPFAPKDPVIGYPLEVVLGTWVPDAKHASELVTAHGSWITVLLALPFLAAVAVAVSGRWNARSLLAVVFAVGSPVVWFGDLYLNQNAPIKFVENGLAYLGVQGYVRYAVVPSMMLLALVVVAADRLLAVRRVPVRVFGGLVLAGVVVLGVTHFVPTTTTRSNGPSWTRSVEQGEHTCTTGHPRPREVGVSGAPVGWFVVLPCADVRPGAHLG